MRGWFPPTVNPEGIASSSPGLRGTGYPGKSCKPRLNPNGVVAALDTLGHNSDGVGSHWRGVPRVARKLAILGFVAQSLRDCGALGFKSRRKTRPTAALLIPHIALVPLDLVLAKQGPQLILKTRFLVMLLLLGDVPDDLLQI